MKEIDEIEKTEKFIVLLLGSGKELVNELFLQKELFIFSEMNESLKEVFNFKKHYMGPYSDVIHSALDSPLYLEEAFKLEQNVVILTEEGKKRFSEILEDEEYKEIFPYFKLLRNIYEKLSYNELLFLIYATYPRYAEKSNRYEYLFQKLNKERILNGLLKKGLITPERFEELK